MTVPPSESLLALAHGIDAERAHQLSRDLSGAPCPELGVLIGTAYPPLTPSLDWQHDLVAALGRDGWRVHRQRADVMTRLLSSVGDLSDSERVGSNLRRFVWGEKLRIALRELVPHDMGGASVDVTARELSDLADASFEVALAEAANRVRNRFGSPLTAEGKPSSMVVFGMGKLGGLELNAGSDVDVVFIYDTDDGGSETALHDHWSRVARHAVATLDTPTSEGMVWRVDLRLRPEGSQGAIANSVAAAERYYETWGRLWERAAMLRARPIAGDQGLGALVNREIISPFVFRRAVDPNIATALAELVQRSRAELSVDPERDLKLGRGGIREAEFFIQSLQLIWGGREPSLRVAGSFAALSRLRSRGLVTDREAREIAQAYLLLRRLEHRVQWMSGIQTHLLPDDRHELGRLARTLAYQDTDQMLEQLAQARETVNELFESLAPTAPRPLPRVSPLLAELDRDEPDLASIAERELGNPEVGEHLMALASRPDGLLGTHTRERFPELASHLMDAVAESPDPLQATRYLRAFFGRFSSPSPYVAALAEDSHAVHRLVTVLGASEFVGDALTSRPDLADVVLFGGGLVEAPRRTVAQELDTFQRSAPAALDEYQRREAFVAALRRAKRRTMVEVAVADLAGTIGTREATEILSDLADEQLEQALRFELDGPPDGLSIIAVGKLGGRDIGYGSDLDVLLIFDPDAAPDPLEAQPFFVKHAQRLIRLISQPHPSGRGYELDTRLRPSGSHGMLVTSLASFARYHGVSLDDDESGNRPSVLSSGEAWERQALLRARACAGDQELGRRVEQVAEQAAYNAGAPPVEEMHRLRMRMENELGRERAGRYDLKSGRGGLLDIEFATQWLQMAHGRDPRVRTQDTAKALDALQVCGYLARDDAETLREGYIFLRRLEQRIHVLRGSGTTVIDERLPGLAQLARRMGILSSARRSAAQTLILRYLDVTGAVRACYERVLGLPAS